MTQTNIDLNELAARVHQANYNWWHDLETGEPIKRNKGELLMLVVTELAEAVEGIRKNLMDDKLPHRKMEEVEMADAYIRILDYAGGFKLHIPSMMNMTDALLSDNKAESIMCLVWAVSDSFSDPGNNICVAVLLKSIESYCKKFNLDLFGAIEEKLAYNASREDHKPEHRRTANGKKF